LRSGFAAQGVVRVYGFHFRVCQSAIFSLQRGAGGLFFFFAGGVLMFFSAPPAKDVTAASRGDRVAYGNAG
jgi:hypothetical protein